MSDPFKNNFDSVASAKESNGGITSLKETNDAFWDLGAFNEANWNKSFPYQFVILERSGNEWKKPSGLIDNNLKYYTKFTLPIPPQEMSISTPFAINTVATLGGILEEHNGAPFRMISFSGTTGIVPLKGNMGVRKSDSLLSGLFQGTVRAAETLATGFTSGVLGNVSIKNIVNVSQQELQFSTGYAQFILLRNFLEAYAALKKKREGGRFALGFSIYKDAETYLCTPVSFELKRSASSPMEYVYSMQLKAWRRINLADLGNNVTKFSKLGPTIRDANKVAKAYNKFRAARATLQNASKVLTSVRGDINKNIFGSMREVGLFVKDFLSIPVTAMDLPAEIIQDLSDSITSLNNNVNSGLSDFVNSRDGFAGRVSTASQNLATSVKNFSKISGLAETQVSAYSGVNDVRSLTSGGSQPVDPVDNNNNVGDNIANDIAGAFNDPDSNAEFFDKIQLGSLNIKTHVVRKIAEERSRVSKFTRLDFEEKRNQVIDTIATYADFVGAGSSTFDDVYGRTPITSSRTPTDDDWDIIFNLNEIATFYNTLAASVAIDKSSKTSAMEYIAGVASNAEIPFQVPRSAYAVPFPYGTTLERLSQRYLNDVDRWHEIATLNNLRAPYVDEEGFSLSLLINGDRNEIQIDSIENITMGQNVWISSSTQSKEKRKVIAIRTLGPSNHIITLSGELDLNRFKVNDSARIDAFLPGTVNSLQLIWIPSDQAPAQPDLEPKPGATLEDFESLLEAGGVDLLLKENGDLTITPDGDCKLAVGLQNIVQVLKLGLSTEINSLLHHSDYGFGVLAGSSTADISAEDVLKAAKKTIETDPMFSGVVAATVTKRGGTLDIGLSVGINGFSQFIPINFTLRNQS